MLIAGLPGFNDAQNRTPLSLWAISGAPLITGNNLATLSGSTRAILTNREMVAIDQDPLGRQGVKVAEDQSGLQVYSKVLSGSGRRAVVLLNRTGSAATITARWAALGLTGSASVHNVWTASDLGSFSTSFATTVPAGEAVLLTIAGTDAAGAGWQIVGTQSGRCVDVPNAATTNGTQVQLWDCNGQVNQSQWNLNANGTIAGAQSNLCLDANNQGTANGTKLILWACNGQANQQWTLR